MINRIVKRREPGEQQSLPARLDVIIKQQADDGAIDGLPDIKVETVEPEIIAILEDNKRVASRLKGHCPKSVMVFGTTDKQ